MQTLLTASVPHAIDPHPLALVPFAVLLLAIATMPLVFKHHWERWFHLISIGLGALAASYYLFVLRQQERLLRSSRHPGSVLASSPRGPK